jgi:hypothetical protein
VGGTAATGCSLTLMRPFGNGNDSAALCVVELKTSILGGGGVFLVLIGKICPVYPQDIWLCHAEVGRTLVLSPNTYIPIGCFAVTAGVTGSWGILTMLL